MFTILLITWRERKCYNICIFCHLPSKFYLNFTISEKLFNSILKQATVFAVCKLHNHCFCEPTRSADFETHIRVAWCLMKCAFCVLSGSNRHANNFSCNSKLSWFYTQVTCSYMWCYFFNYTLLLTRLTIHLILCYPSVLIVPLCSLKLRNLWVVC
jgi:hypothetical protein